MSRISRISRMARAHVPAARRCAALRSPYGTESRDSCPCPHALLRSRMAAVHARGCAVLRGSA
eukprot:3308128-Rhodomonas_salina.1